MSFLISDLVEITDPQNQTPAQIGFISEVGAKTLEVSLLGPDGLVDIIDIDIEQVRNTKSMLAKKYYEIYQQSLDDIAKEAEERKKKRSLVTNYLSRKYKITPDEVYGIYTAMLSFEEYYEDFLKKEFKI